MMHKTLVLIGLIALMASPVFAAWSTDPGVDILISGASTGAWGHQVLHDGSGGYFVCWYDDRVVDEDIYLQHYNYNAEALWPAAILICGETGNQRAPKMILDNAGGVVISWVDNRAATWDIHAQRIDSSGDALWTAGGVWVMDSNTWNCGWLVPDGTGGALIFGRSGLMNRIDGDGTLIWSAADACLTFDATAGNYLKVLPDGAWGAFLVWGDVNGDVAVQRVDVDGNLLWNSGANTLLTDTASAQCMRIAPAGDGFVVIWADTELRAQKVNGAGVAQWTDPNGVTVTADFVNNQDFHVTTDGAGGALAIWEGLADGNMYMQRLASADGAGVWAAPVALHTTGDADWTTCRPGNLAPDGAGGAIAVWSTDSYVLMAQRVDSSGTLKWGADGAIVANSTVTFHRYCARVATNGQGSAVVAYTADPNGGSDSDLFMQGLTWDGSVGAPGFSSGSSSSSSSRCGILGGLNLLLAALAAGFVLRRKKK
jgi:hypothetical protein